MNALADYGSSSSDEDNNDDEVKAKVVVAPNNNSNNNSKNRGGPTAAAAAAAGPASLVGPKTISLTSKMPPPPTTKESKKGKKILSLQAVLPAHILKQLTQSQVQGKRRDGKTGDDDIVDDDDDDDIDDDDDDDDWQPASASSAAAAKAAASRTKRAAAAAGKDAGIDSFLSELQKSAPTHMAKRLVATKHKGGGDTTTTTGTSTSSSGKLGAAFLSNAITVTKSGGTNNSTVRDIHNETTATTTANATRMPLGNDTTSTAAEAAVPKPSPSPSSSSYYHEVPRPSRNAAPLKQAPTATAAFNVDTFATTGQREAEDAQREQQPQQPQQPSKRPRRNRQEMERLLRQGHLDEALGGDDNNNNNDSSNTNNIISLQQPQSFVPTDGASEPVDTTGMVRMAPTAMYDPQAGQAVATVGAGAATKGRGKNQINHLLASAANLEMARARGMVTKPGGHNSHRANAKRKYGW